MTQETKRILKFDFLRNRVTSVLSAFTLMAILISLTSNQTVARFGEIESFTKLGLDYFLSNFFTTKRDGSTFDRCFCGNTINRPSATSTSCNNTCSGNTAEICGGRNLCNVYESRKFSHILK
jgi:hypothetical protein